MDFVAQLWLPIVVSAVLIFIASSLIHMVIQWHKSDYNKLANEDDVRAALRAANASPQQYVVPYCPGMKDMQAPEMQKKFTEGPIAFITFRPPGVPKMGGALGSWFAYTLVISAIAAYVAHKTLTPMGPDVHFLQVCRVASAIAFVAFGGGSVQQGIWMGKPWASVAKELLDAAIYAAITGVTFAWLWPG
jgi:hypothetical protein